MYRRPSVEELPTKRPRLVARTNEDSFYDADEDVLLSQACLPSATQRGKILGNRQASGSFWDDGTDATSRQQQMRAEMNKAKGQLIQLQKKLDNQEIEKKRMNAKMIDLRNESDHMRREIEELRRQKEHELSEIRKQFMFEKQIEYADNLRKAEAGGSKIQAATTPQFPRLPDGLRKVPPRTSSTETKEFYSRLPKHRYQPDSSHPGRVFEHTQHTDVLDVAKVAQEWRDAAAKGIFTVDEGMQTDPIPPRPSIDEYRRYCDVYQMALQAAPRIIRSDDKTLKFREVFRPLLQVLRDPTSCRIHEYLSK